MVTCMQVPPEFGIPESHSQRKRSFFRFSLKVCKMVVGLLKFDYCLNEALLTSSLEINVADSIV
jgi:hypothetical protein